MSVRKVRVLVNGYGVIGKRIADAIAAQDDLDLLGGADAVWQPAHKSRAW